MRLRDLALNLDDQPGETLTQRIAKGLEQAIRDGRLAPGVALPGSRSLAEDLGVTRNTVIAALNLLEDEGWLVTERARGTFVAPNLPLDVKPTQSTSISGGQHLGFDLPSNLSPLSKIVPQRLDLVNGAPDARLAPTDAMAKAYQRALRRHGEELLSYGEPAGNQMLREAVATWATERHGVPVTFKQVLITRGSRAALTLLSLALLREGDAVGVESPGNRGAWDIFRQCSKAELLPLPMDEQGLCVDELQKTLEQRRVKALYLMPRRQYPTTRSMHPERAKTLLELAARHRMAILEDDHDAEYHYGEQRPLPLLAMDKTGQVIHIGSLSRLLAPGLRLGFLIAHESLVERLGRVRRNTEHQGDRVLEWSVADLIRDGEVARHLRKVRRIYEARRDFLTDRLKSELGHALEFEVPAGGLSLWAKVSKDIDASAWVQRMAQQGLALTEPQQFYLENPEGYIRIGFSQADEVELEEAVRRMRLALK